MAIFGRETPIEPQPELEPEPLPEPPPEPKTGEEDISFLELEPEPPGTPRQRGTILEERAAVTRFQLQIADNLRQKLLAPDVPLELPLERTPEREQIVISSLERLTSNNNFRIPPKITKDQFYGNIRDEVFGFGPIQPFIDRDDINEIMVNGPYIVFVERNGRMRESGYKFLDDDHVERIIKRIVLPLGRVVSSEHPLIDARYLLNIPGQPQF